MSDVVTEYYKRLTDYAFGGTGEKVSVPSEYHAQVNEIDTVLSNDKSSLISRIVEFMIQSASVDINISSDNKKTSTLLNAWKKTVNKDVNIDIQKGLRSFTEQYFRERWKSSFIVTRIKWKKINGYDIPYKMWVMDGGSIHAENNKGAVNTTEYYVGEPDKDKKTNKLKSTKSETVIVRKPYNSWYDVYPDPYLVKTGALYQYKFKSTLLDRQAEVIETAFPYQFFIKMGSEEALKRNIVAQEQEMKDMQDRFQKLKRDSRYHIGAKGKVGAFPHNTNFEELIPDYKKALEESITKSVDKNILYALGLIELKGMSSNREEAILNPEVLVTEIKEGVKDYVTLIKEIVSLTVERNQGKSIAKSKISIKPNIIEGFISDDMRTFFRSLYDRGLVSKKSMIDVTDMDFETQVMEREYEAENDIDVIMYPQLTQNMEKYPPNVPNDLTDEVPDDKKKDTPEADNYKNATFLTAFKSVRDIPSNIRDVLGKDKQKIFRLAFNKMHRTLEESDYDNALKEQFSLEYACERVKEYIQAPYDKNSDLPKNVRNVLPKSAQTIYRKAFNQALEDSKPEEQSFKIAWSAVKAKYIKDEDGDWIKK